MKIKAQVFRDGTSQRSRSLRSLDPDYISVDERTLADWIRLAQTYAKDLTYFNALNQPEGDWAAFFAGDAQAIAEAVEALDALDAADAADSKAGGTEVVTETAAISPDILQILAQPHFALFLTFLKLLRYPQQQFKALTQRRLDFYYRQVLRLAEKAATPEQAHVIFSLAPNQADYVLPKGTRLSAGTDAQGNDLHYGVDSDLYLTQAQVASVKTLSLEKIDINLEVIHLADDRTAIAFEKMLRWAIGTPNQGDALPPLPSTDPLAQDEDTLSAIVALFQEIRDYSLEQVTAERQQYILNQLNFATLEDFQFCLDVHSREMAKQQGGQEIVPPTELEWQQVYRLVEKAYRKKINRDRRDRLKKEHHSDQYSDAAAAFLGVWRFALGDPLPGDLLPFFPEQQEVNLDDLLADLAGANSEAAARYIQENLFLSVSDFQRMMDIQQRATGIEESPEWDEVYRLLERAQTRKRAFTYPSIGRTEIKTICATAIADAQPDQPPNPPLELPRFQPFVAQPLCESNGVQSLGVAIAAPILHLQEGHRAITLTLACQAETFNQGILEELLALGEWPFAVTISSESGWLSIPPADLQMAVGDFFLESPLTRYSQAALAPIYQTAEAAFEESQAGHYLRFPEGSLYRIETVLSPTRIRLSFVGKGAPSEAIEQYATLALGGRSTVLNDIQLSEDRRELIASSNRFRATDVGAFIVLAGGEIYQIEEFANATRLGIRYWGYLPGTGQTRKYPQITFSSVPIASFSDLTLTGIALTSAAEAGARFTPKDVGTHLAWVNGDIYQLIGLVGDREATVISIGRIEQLPTPATPVEQYSAAGIYLNSLQFQFTLEATQPAITAPSVADSLVTFQTADPVVKLTLEEQAQTENNEAGYYQSFKDLCLEKANIQVAVQDLQTLQLRSDRTVLNPKSPFEPFDSQPTAGASLYFAHPEIVSKPLDSLSLKLEWMGLPDSFATHYYAYAHCGLSPRPPVIHNNSFQARLDLLLNRSWHTIATHPLFSTEGTGETATVSSQATLQYDKAQFAEIPAAGFATVSEIPATHDLWEHSRYFRLELTRPDFQHGLYPLVLNKVARAGATDFVDAQGNPVSGNQAGAIEVQSLSVYPPYTPKIKSIILDYQASAEIHLKAKTSDPPQGQIFQLHPFGYLNLRQTADPAGPNSGYYLLPQYDHEGCLFIGLRDLQPPQQLTLLFQLVSGSGNADLANPKIQWSYLAGDRWQPFPNEDILSDSTNGLMDSGIVHFTIPAAATQQNHQLPAGLHWLRATVSNHAIAIPDALDIRTQAVTATFIDQDNDPEHLSQPLAADAIQGLVERTPAISAVAQPYSSFGGRRQETNRAFYTRVSERLRHKYRAVTRWDYERLVLEQFPQIYKVKCLTQAEQSHAPSAAQVTVVVIPNLANTAPFLPLEPKAPQYLLREIETYLQAHASPFVRVVVKNPHYEQIKYRVAVRFRTGYEQGYYLKQLNEALVRFLSPWAYEEQSDISFGSSIHSSAVIHFIETRPYVDYVANLKLIEQVTLSTDNRSKVDTIYQINPNNLAQVKQVDSILVSAPEHIIDLITTSDYEEESFEGLDYMIVDLDFVVI